MYGVYCIRDTRASSNLTRPRTPSAPKLAPLPHPPLPSSKFPTPHTHAMSAKHNARTNQQPSTTACDLDRGTDL
eukprot:2832660-Rhodomonas_salina.2